MTIERVIDAIRENDAGLLDQIINKNAHLLNHKLNGTYPLHMCVGHVECFKVLLGHGANLGLTNQDGKQPIHLAVERDFVETLMYLVIHGADYDAPIAGPESDTNRKTPLQIAIEEEAYTCQDFLHFLGAKIPENQHGILNDESKSKYDIIRKGFDDGKIVSGGREIPANSRRPEYIVSRTGNSVDIGFQGYNESFIVYVRRMEVEYQSHSTRIPMVSIPEGMELISDIYQYRVEKNVTCDLYIPVSGMDKPDKYKELVVIQMTNFERTSKDVHRNVDIANSKAVIKGINLCAYGSSPIVSFGIFMSIKTDSKTVDPNKDLTLQSSVEHLFAVEVPAGAAPASTEIQLKVMRASSDAQSSDSGYGSNSDFHSVASINTQKSEGHSDITYNDSAVDITRPSSAASRMSKTKEELYVKLPKPKEEPGLQPKVLKCPQGEDGTESSNWELQENAKVKGNILECNGAVFANYIVVNVTKFGHLVKEFVSDLFSRSKGDKQMCKLFAMVNHRSNTSEYLVEVVLCHVDDYKERLGDYLKRNFREQECGPTDEIEIDSKCTYMLKLHIRYAKIIFGPDNLPIQYQGKHPKSQNFTVETESSGDKSASGRVFSFKKNVPKKEIYYGKKCIRTLAIRFSTCKTNTIQPGQFLSDERIDDVAMKSIGDKWFALGIHLGFSCEELFALQDTPPLKRNSMILYKWRDDKSRSWDEKLNNFVLATRQAELPKLRKAIVEGDVVKFRNTNGLDRWIQKYTDSATDTQKIRLNFNNLESKPVSPLDDKFLLFIATKLGRDDIMFIQLDLSNAELEERISNPTQRKCKFLVLARDKCASCIEFLKKLKHVMLRQSLNLTVEEISEYARQWLNSEEASHHESRDVLQAIFR